MADEEDYSKLPLLERATHKVGPVSPSFPPRQLLAGAPEGNPFPNTL